MPQPKKPRALSIPTITVDGAQYVRREHFDTAVMCATMNQAACMALQRERDQWQTKYLQSVHGRRRR